MWHIHLALGKFAGKLWLFFDRPVWKKGSDCFLTAAA
jgi:hypothetical protein